MKLSLSIRRARERAARARTELRAAFRLVDRRWQEEVAPIAACQAGCSACCHMRSDIFQAEGDLIARQIADRPEIVARVRENAAKLAGLILPELMRELMACALLDPASRLCRVYKAPRPLACRAYASCSAHPCRDHVEKGPRPIAGARDLYEAELIAHGLAFGRGQEARVEAVMKHRALARAWKNSETGELHQIVARSLDRIEAGR
jgi:Fe-S-cluster containining protein